jgi:hypothetical protein
MSGRWRDAVALDGREARIGCVRRSWPEGSRVQRRMQSRTLFTLTAAFSGNNVVSPAASSEVH